MKNLIEKAQGNPDNTIENKKKVYTKPTLSQLGTIASVTLGNGGSSCDMHNTHQQGGGNDNHGPCK